MLYPFYRLGRFLALHMRIGTCYALAVFFADFYHFFAREDRENLEYNLRVVLKEKSDKEIKKLVRNIFRNFAKYLADFFRFSKLTRDYILNHITVKGKENVDKALSAGKGAIILTAHIGNWELGGAVIASLGYPFHAIALDHKEKRVNDFFLEQRSSCDVNIIPIGAELKNCFRVLRKNHLLAILGDRDFSNHGVKAEFFGRQTILPRGPAIFSMKTGAPIIPAFFVRTRSDRFELVFENPMESQNSGDEKRDALNLMRRYTAVIEKYIRSYPDQWYAFRKMWDY